MEHGTYENHTASIDIHIYWPLVIIFPYFVLRDLFQRIYKQHIQGKVTELFSQPTPITMSTLTIVKEHKI